MWKSSFFVAVLFACLLPACSRGVDNDLDQEKKNLEAVFQKYLESVRTADPDLGSQVWQQSSEVSVITPFGRYTGWDSVRNDIYINFLQKAFKERHLRADNLAIRISGDVAWAVFDWTFTAKLPDGQPFSSTGWESHVYRKVDGRWSLAHLHYSAPIPQQN